MIQGKRNRESVEKGKLLFRPPSLLRKSVQIMRVVLVFLGVGGIIGLIWTWFTFGNTDIFTWNILWWDLFIITVVIMIPAGIIMILAALTSQIFAIYEKGFVPRYRPLKYALRGEEVFIPWEDVVYMEYMGFEEKPVNIGGSTVHIGKGGFKIYYKLDGKIWCEVIGDKNGWIVKEKYYREFMAMVNKLYDVYLTLKREGKLLPEKPKRVEMTL